METMYQILGLIAAGLILWFLHRSVKGRPELFTGEKMSKSFGTIGILALILIIFIAGMVLLLKYG